MKEIALREATGGRTVDNNNRASLAFLLSLFLWPAVTTIKPTDKHASSRRRRRCRQCGLRKTSADVKREQDLKNN